MATIMNLPLHFRIEPLDTPAPSAGMFVVCWPEANADRAVLAQRAPGPARARLRIRGRAGPSTAAGALPGARGAAVQRLERAVVRQRARVLGGMTSREANRGKGWKLFVRNVDRMRLS